MADRTSCWRVTGGTTRGPPTAMRCSSALPSSRKSRLAEKKVASSASPSDGRRVWPFPLPCWRSLFLYLLLTVGPGLSSSAHGLSGLCRRLYSMLFVLKGSICPHRSECASPTLCRQKSTKEARWRCDAKRCSAHAAVTVQCWPAAHQRWGKHRCDNLRTGACLVAW